MVWLNVNALWSLCADDHGAPRTPSKEQHQQSANDGLLLKRRRTSYLIFLAFVSNAGTARTVDAGWIALVIHWFDYNPLNALNSKNYQSTYDSFDK